MKKAVANMITANSTKSSDDGRNLATLPPRNAPAMPAPAKTRAVRQTTLPARAWATAATAEVAPTTRSDEAMALFSSMPRA
jgi:hypothetical protein